MILLKHLEFYCQKQFDFSRIIEYSTISMLGYFKDILANAGLPETWLEWYLKPDWNDARIMSDTVSQAPDQRPQGNQWERGISNQVGHPHD